MWHEFIQHAFPENGDLPGAAMDAGVTAVTKPPGPGPKEADVPAGVTQGAVGLCVAACAGERVAEGLRTSRGGGAELGNARPQSPPWPVRPGLCPECRCDCPELACVSACLGDHGQPHLADSRVAGLYF